MADTDNLKDTKEYFLDIPMKALAVKRPRRQRARLGDAEPAVAHLPARLGQDRDAGR